MNREADFGKSIFACTSKIWNFETYHRKANPFSRIGSNRFNNCGPVVMYSLILHGKRLVDLQKCHNLSRIPLRLLQNASSFSKPFSSSASAAAADLSSRDIFTISSYLVDSLGFTTKLAESISRKVSSEAKGNPVSVLNLLTSYGFAEAQIRDIVTDYPLLLVADAEKSLGPKIKFLQSRVASSSELTEILSKAPKILGRKGEKTIGVYYDFAREIIIEADKSPKLEKLCHSLPQGSKQENKIRNISVLREVGVPQKLLLSLLISDVGPVSGKEKFEEALKKVVEMGFDPTTPKFVEALKVIYRITGKAREAKISVYERLGFDVWGIFKKWPSFLNYSEKNIVNSIETFIGLGFTRDEFVMMVKRLPPCIGLSAETVKKKTEFLVKEMDWPLKVVASHPQVLGLSMEKRIVPRCNVIKALLSKGLLGNGSELPSLTCVLSTTDKTFLNMYVMKHDKLVPELMDIFNGRTCFIDLKALPQQ